MENFNYELKQFRPNAPRKNDYSGFDEVVDFRLIFNDGQYSCAVARRKSGRVDLYYNGILCQSKSS